MIGFAVGYIYGHLAEWAIHKYILHGWGKSKGSLFSFHFFDHHRNARLNNFIDTAYLDSIFQWNEIGKEIFYLSLLMIAHIPLFLLFPYFTLALFYSAAEYYYLHRKSHIDLEWARKNLPWHFDHHMALNQDMNWGVRSDWVDRLFNTRLVYLDTERERADTQRRSLKTSNG